MKKGGRTYRSFRCAANTSRGPAVGDNDLPISELKLLTAVAHTIRTTVDDYWPDFERAFREKWAAEVSRQTAAAPALALDEEIARQTAKVDRLAALLADKGDVDAIVRRLRTEEARVHELRARRAAATTARPSLRAPSVERLRAHILDVAGTLAADP